MCPRSMAGVPSFNWEEYMRSYVSNDQDWEKKDDEDSWGIKYTEPTAQIREKIETILHTWGEEQPEEE